MPAPDATPLLLPTADYINAGVPTVTSTADILNKSIAASLFLQRICNRRFDERIDTLKHTAKYSIFGGDLIDSYTLLLKGDLKSVTTFAYDVQVGADISTGTAITSGYQLVYEDDVNSVTSARKIALDSLQTASLNVPVYEPVNSIHVKGVWGYGGQWVSVTTLNGAIADTTTTSVTVTSGAGAGIEAGMVLKVDSEYLYIDSVSTNTLTVTRAVNGSTAATHLTAITVYYWQPMQLVKSLVRRLVQWAYEQIKAPMAGAVTIGEFQYPVDTSGLPKDVYKMIADSGLQYRRLRIFK